MFLAILLAPPALPAEGDGSVGAAQAPTGPPIQQATKRADPSQTEPESSPPKAGAGAVLPEPVGEPPTSAPTVAPAPAIPDLVWDGLRGHQVDLHRTDGSLVRGELANYDATMVAIIAASGQVVVVPRAEVIEVLAVPNEAVVAPAPAPALQPTPEANKPKFIIHDQAAYKKGTGMLAGGVVTMGVGLITATVGLVLIPVLELLTFGSGTGARVGGLYVAVPGAAIALGVGLPLTIVGGKKRKAARTPVVSFEPAAAGLRLRF